MDIKENIILMTETYFELRKQLVSLTEDLMKYHLSVEGSEPHAYEEGKDLMFNGMMELVSSVGVELFSIEHGVDKMSVEYLQSKLQEIKEARLNIAESYINGVCIDTYMFIDKDGMSLYSVKR